MRGISYCVSLFVCTLSCFAAEAATVAQPSARILLNQGKGFKPATDRMAIKPGDQVMVAAGESVEIAYSERCKLTIEPGAVVTIPARSPCEKTAIAPPEKLGGCSLKDDWQACHIEPERPRSHFLLGVGALGVYAGTMIWLTDNSASP